MRIVCLVSHNPGHLDFGGDGFVRLAQRLTDRGHRVSWFSGGSVTGQLAERGQHVEIEVTTELLLSAVLSRCTEDVEWSRSCEVMQALRSALQRSEAQCLLADRCLAVAAPIAASLSLPCVAIGTPGGIWVRSAKGLVPAQRPVESSLALSHRLRATIDWFDGDMDSEWLRSPLLNVSFLGRSFYKACAGPSSAFVQLFDQEKGRTSNRGDRLGFAFGHTGDLQVLQRVLAAVLETHSYPSAKIDLFLGGRPQVRGQFRRYLPSGLRIHGWEDYRRVFTELCGLVTFGGIGTLWHSIEQNVPTIVVPGLAGDQWFNGREIEREGMGLFFEGQGAPPISALLEAGERQEKFIRFKKRDNFSDDLDSVCQRIEALSGPIT